MGWLWVETREAIVSESTLHPNAAWVEMGDIGRDDPASGVALDRHAPCADGMLLQFFHFILRHASPCVVLRSVPQNVVLFTGFL